MELCAHGSGNKHGQPSGIREKSGVGVDPTGPVTTVQMGGDDQDASSGPNRGLWRQPEGLKVRPGWVIVRGPIGLGVCRSGGQVSILHDWAKADMQVPREEKRRNKTDGVISKFRTLSEWRAGN